MSADPPSAPSPNLSLPEEKMSFSFSLLEKSLGIPALLTVDDVIVSKDEKSIMTYLVTIYGAAKGAGNFGVLFLNFFFRIFFLFFFVFGLFSDTLLQSFF